MKFLRGYGCSITVRDSKIVLKNAYDPFSEPESEEWFVNKMPYGKIVLSGKGYVSTEALALLSQNNRNVILLDTYGKPISYINSAMDSMTGTAYRIAQYDTFRNPEKRQYLINQIVKAKIESQIRFLKSLDNDLIADEIKILEEILIESNSERRASRIYFRAFAKIIPSRFGFVSRNQHSQTITKQNATDVINALLNYGYAVLAGEISKYVNGIGLDAYYGFHHKQHTSFQPLVYDLIEPFRWLVDYTVYRLATSVNNGQMIRKKDYAHTRQGLVVMDYDLVRRFLEMLERTFQKERRYEFRHGAKTKDGLKSCQEIMIAKIVVIKLAEFCKGKNNNFGI